jgi:hypothetical protein
LRISRVGYNGIGRSKLSHTGHIIPGIHINQPQVIIMLMAGEAAVGGGGCWIRAVAAEGQVAGQGVALNLAVRLGQEGCAAQVVGVVVEQAVVVRQGSGPMQPG